MLERTVEQLLLQFLDPYVEGISRDKLHFGVFSGSLELKDLTVRPDALTIMGLEGFRVRSGSIRLISLLMPLRNIYHGKVQIIIDALHLEVEQTTDASGDQSEEDLVEEIRSGKRKAIETRMNQLRELMEEKAVTTTEKSTFRVKLFKKIVNNLRVQIKDVQVSISSTRGLACGFELPMLGLMSTDRTFRELAAKEEVVLEGKSMYKLVQLQKLGFRMSLVGNCSLEGAEYVVSPISANLQVAHELDNPSDQVFKLRLEVATEELAELTIRRSQVKHLRGILAASSAESERLHALMVPPAEEKSIFEDTSRTKAEYIRLYERHLMHEWKLAGEDDEKFSSADEARMRLLEDAFSVRLLAKQRWIVRSKVEALNEEVTRRQRDKEQETDRSKSSFFRRMASRWSTSEPSEAGAETPTQWITNEEREQLMRDMDDDSKVEEVDVPQRFRFELVLGQMQVELKDDRWKDAHQQLLHLSLRDAEWNIGVHMTHDYRGQDSAEWQVECHLSSFRALHTMKPVFTFTPPGFFGQGSEEAPLDLRQAAWQERPDDAHADTQQFAAWWLLKNELQDDCNLLKLEFEFQPLRLNWPPGGLEQLLEFIRAPENAYPDQAAPKKLPRSLTMLEHELRQEELVDGMKSFMQAHGDRAREVAAQVYDRIPDKIDLRLKIASPIIHVPVDDLGEAEFSLGEFTLHTTEPAELYSWDLALDLNHTALRAQSARGERFDMIHPVPVHLDITYRGSDDEHSITVCMGVEEMTLSLSPQALSILLSTPGAVASIIYPNYGEEAQGEADPTAVPEPSSEPQSNSDRSTLTERASEIARKVGASEVVEAAVRTVTEARRRFMRCNFTMQINSINLTLADSIVPVMRLHGFMIQPGFVLYYQNMPFLMTIDIEDGVLEWDTLNPRNGAWEPFGERFHLGLHMERKLQGEDGRMTSVTVKGHQPLLLNLTPSAVKQAAWILPQFYKSLTFQPLDEILKGINRNEEVAQTGVKYRVISLYDQPVELEFRSSNKQGLITRIEPTGSAWQPLDKWVLPYFSTALVARLPGSDRCSDLLSLERPGAVTIPGTGAVAEILSPSPSHRLLLLATTLRVHNQTDMRLTLRFHIAQYERTVLPLVLDETSICDAALLGQAMPQSLVTSYHEEAEVTKEAHSLILPPNAICSVPEMAFARAGGSRLSNSHAWISVRPSAIDAQFCTAAEVGVGLDACTVVCRSRSRGKDHVHRHVHRNANDMHFVYDCRSHDSNGVRYEHSEIERTFENDAYSPFKMTTVKVRPTLSFLNAVPINNLTVGFASAAGVQDLDDLDHMNVMEAEVPCFSRVNLYNFPGVLREGICVRAKFDPSDEWSDVVHFSREAFRESDSKKTLDLCQKKDGASAGVVVEPVSRCEMRFSSPFWFVDRSGLERTHKVELRCKRRRLPHYKALSLLPANCLEETCQLVLKLPNETKVQDVLVPPNFAMLALKTSSGPFVFCMQTDDIQSSDVLGAQCQVVTLRPRLVLTNSSEHEIELKFVEGQVQSLRPGESIEWHWTVEEDQDSPKTSLLFRPKREFPCQWSGTVVCGDAAAGSTPFLLPVSEKRGVGDGRQTAEVWTAEVAPVRGALAVSFRVGSDFIAANKVRRKKVNMAIRPYDCPDSLADISIPSGKEVPYGWAKPFRPGPDHCSVVVKVNLQSYKIDDVRKTKLYRIPKDDVAIVVRKYGTQTLLSVEDYKSKDSKSSPMTSGGSCYQVDLKLSQLGLSLVEDAPTPRELLFMHFDLIRFRWTKDSNGIQQFFLAISDAQVNCQVPGRVDGATMDVRRNESLGLLKQTVPAVILANCAEGDRAFLNLALTRGATSSRDLLLPKAEIAVDAMDVTVDDGWLDPLVRFMSEASFNRTERGLSFKHISQTAGKNIVFGYSPPQLPYVLQIESMRISSIDLTAFCSLKLSSRLIRVLPQHLRTALQVLSISHQLKLDGAPIVLPERHLQPHRGSLSDFLWGLRNEYSTTLISNAASVLGKSSVLNVPRAPIKLGGTFISYLSDSAGLVAGEGASVLNTLTFDDEYVAKQRAIRENKKITGFGDGVVEAGKSLTQGIEGFSDIFTKPIEGHKEDGFKGLLAGLGKGAIGSFVKPLAGLGQAMQDVGTGIASAVTPDTAQMKRRRNRVRTRHPRLLFTELGVLRPWSDLEAEVLHQLGADVTHGVIEVVPLTEGQDCSLLLLFAQRFLIVEVVRKGKDLPAQRAAPRRGGATSTPSSSSSSGGVAVQRAAGVGEDAPSADFLGAIDESAMKLFSQAVKPFNTLVYGAQDIAGEWKAPGAEAGPPADAGPSRNTREFFFADLRDVRWSADGPQVLELLRRGREKRFFLLPLGAAPISDAVRNALFSGFKSTLNQTGHAASWEELRVAMAAEQRARSETLCEELMLKATLPTGAGQRLLEVFEVERWSRLPDGRWRTPWLPQIDRESSYRWMDASMHRHPHLDFAMPREALAEKTKPPCKLDAIFKPISGWQIEVDEEFTDERGWRYALAWNSSTWDPKPGSFNVVRKRRWSRLYA